MGIIQEYTLKEYEYNMKEQECNIKINSSIICNIMRVGK